MAQEVHFPGSTILLVLALLETGDKYGYQIIRELDARSDKTFALREGMLYPVLHRLERQGDIRAYEHTDGLGRRRRYYQLTRQGVRALTRKRREWSLFCKKFGKMAGGEACDRL